MRIVYVSDERFPYTGTDTQQVAMTVQALVRAGVSATLMPPAMRTREGDPSQAEAIHAYYGTAFPVVPVHTVSPHRRGLVKCLHPLLATRLLRKHPPDLIYCRNFLVAAVALWRGFKVVFESYRVIDRKYPRLARLFGKMSRNPRFLGVITHSSISAAGFERVGVPSEKIQVIYNGFDPATMEPPLEKDVARRKTELPQEGSIALYTGHINGKKGIEMLAQLAKDTPEVTHVWVGDDGQGSNQYAEKLIAQYGLNNVHLPGWLPPTELPPFLYAADVLLIPATVGPLEKYGNTVLPMKVFSYMAAGRPIIAPDLPDSREVLEHRKNAWLVPPDDPKEAADGLRRILSDPTLATSLGQHARTDAKSLTWSARGERVLTFIRNRLSGP
jgi:glycosyltransferase involved in cell wall biosynthesis